MQSYIHTYIHTYIHIYIYTCIHSSSTSSDNFSQNVLKRSLHHLYNLRPFFLMNVFIIGFSCTVWTKTRSFAGSIADGETFIFLPATKIRKVRGHQKIRNVNEKKKILGRLNASDELSTTMYLQYWLKTSS